ncbi:ABC transporter substrate-binding protein [Pseudomonas sp. G5001]|uniref:ABC transporter substrate-binding protein n=1 Tax=unclassified Pseudomonas TaxID=196821 RepID=UPI0015A305C8|nr:MULTISPECIES: ABC transporter substrate-binding protein [unclassified Pseudomonas]NWB09167.1 ABC transporter substrate-binding protein [Pseudomonas sp. D5002]NWB75093.1 ABC transporter substrate-binding protein [Pseudomonas sp. G5001]
MSENNNKMTQTMHRRDFLKHSAVAGAVAAAFSMGLPLQAFAEEATPKPGGVLRMGLAGGSTTDSRDPGSWVDTFTFVGFSAVYNTLTEIAVDGSAIPELAESFESTPDARTWTFKLRQGVTFHNGKSLTADDVVASINHHLAANSTSAAKTVIGDVASVSAKGSDAVVFELHSGNADFAYVVADYHLVIMPAKDGAADWQAGIGTSGYRLKSFEPGVRMDLERNPDYWKPGRAHFASAELLAIADGAARVNALVTGQVDVINKVDLKTVALLKRNPTLVIEETKGAQHYTFPMLCDSNEFKNNDIRMAMKHAINRETLLASVLHGYGLVGNDHPIQPGSRFINADLEQRTYDPDKSRFYLRKAGVEALKVRLQASDAAYTGAVDASVLFKEQARQAGIDIDVVREPADGYFSNIWMKQPFTTSFWYSSLTADRMFSIGYAKGAAWNETHWNNDRFNQLLNAARGEMNAPLRQEMYNEMQSLCRDDGGAIVPLFASSVAARSNRVSHGPLTAPYGELDGLRLIERWWQA